MKKFLVSILAMLVCFTSMAATALAATPETLDSETTHAVQLQGYISDADGTIVEVIGGGSTREAPIFFFFV